MSPFSYIGRNWTWTSWWKCSCCWSRSTIKDSIAW